MSNKTSPLQQIVLSVSILALGSTALWALDLQQNNLTNTSWTLGSIVSSIFSNTRITTDLLSSTSLKNPSLSSISLSDTFFESILTLPNKQTAKHYQILDPLINITELTTNNPKEIIKELVEQKNSSYSFNVINSKTFYLNQQPLSTKTHNFLAITIGKTIYGFQYKPQDHRFVLEIIDALQKKQ